MGQLDSQQVEEYVGEGLGTGGATCKSNLSPGNKGKNMHDKSTTIHLGRLQRSNRYGGCEQIYCYISIWRSMDEGGGREDDDGGENLQVRGGEHVESLDKRGSQ